ncbi:MAG TPA: GNAT family N-acetyltransferase [Novosphingobium sp.]|nr:GNAT family N-acetyltransferase [Novosphingobium sp.]
MDVMMAAFDPAYGEAWNRRQVEDALALGNCRYGLVDSDGQQPQPGSQAAGFFLSRSGFGEEELLLFAVSPEFRRQGLGRVLLANLVGTAKANGTTRLLLEMRRGNPAEALYRSYGFQPIGVRPNYYRSHDGERIDAITFAARID